MKKLCILFVLLLAGILFAPPLVYVGPTGGTFTKMYSWTTGSTNLDDYIGFYCTASFNRLPRDLTDLVFYQSHTVANFTIANQPKIRTISFPNLTDANTNDVNSGSSPDGYMTIQNNLLLTNVSAPKLLLHGAEMTANTPLLMILSTTNSSINLSSLRTASGDLDLEADTITLTNLETCGGTFRLLAVTSTGFSATNGVSDTFDLSKLRKVFRLISYTGDGTGPTHVQYLSLPALTNVTATAFSGVSISSSPGLTNISIDALVNCKIIAFANNSNLTHASLASWLPGNGGAQLFYNNSLNTESVNHLLARCVANAAFVSGSINLSNAFGWTASSNAAPTGQGLTDKATLQGRGVTVTTW